MSLARHVPLLLPALCGLLLLGLPFVLPVPA